jgi:hypothetical protein
LLQEHQILAGGSSGSSYSAIKRYAFGETSPTVLFLCADRGTAYMDTIYDSAWVTWRREQEMPAPTSRWHSRSSAAPILVEQT